MEALSPGHPVVIVCDLGQQQRPILVMAPFTAHN
jgi:hypothetical protein